MTKLTDKKCAPCEGGIPPLNQEEAQGYLSQISNWRLENNKISRQFKFKNFDEAMVFVNKVADLAKSEDHHPDIHITSWNKVMIELTTHALKGLSENDFIMAAKINQL